MQNYPVGKEFSLKWKHQYKKSKQNGPAHFFQWGCYFAHQKIMKPTYAYFIIFIFNTLSIQ